MASDSVERIVSAAKQALAKVPPNDGDHTVAAACLAENGEVVTGINVTHFTGGPCAEPVALGAAVGSGLLPKSLKLMVAVSRSGVINPCGRCRQQLLDLSPRIEVVVTDKDQTLKVAGVRDLLPFAYTYNKDEENEVAVG